MRSSFSLQQFSVSTAYLLIICLSLHVTRSRASFPVPPDGWECNSNLGFANRFARSACQLAWMQMPMGPQPKSFTTRTSFTSSSNDIQVPVLYKDNEANPQCMITIDLDGHSKDNVSVEVSWNDIKQMAWSLMAQCIPQQLGGVRTYGMANTLQALLESTAYSDGSPINLGGVPAAVEQPDGTINSVAIPESLSVSADGGYDVPYYMTITLSGSVDLDPEENDFFIIDLLFDFLSHKFISSTPQQQNGAANVLKGLGESHHKASYDVDARWWEFPLQPQTPSPANVKYTCDSTLGVPSSASCEIVLYQFINIRNVVVDPAQGPIIKTSATSQPTLPRSIEIDIYLQDAFHGPANQTCAWGIVSSHQGNVGQCPASNAPATPARPPDRGLLEGSPVPSGAPEAIIYFNSASNITVAAPSIAPTGSTAVSLAYPIASSPNPTASVPNPDLPNPTANLGGPGCLIAC